MRRLRGATSTGAITADGDDDSVHDKKRPFGVIPNELVVLARVQVQRRMPVWMAKTRRLVLRGSKKAPILAVYKHVMGGCVSDDDPLKVMVLGDDTIVHVAGEKSMMVGNSRGVRKHDTWVISFESSGERKRMYELVKMWIELSAFLQTLSGFESIAKSKSSVVYRCHMQAHPGASSESLSSSPSSRSHRGSRHRGRRFALKRVGKAHSRHELEITERALSIEELQPYLARYLYMYESSDDNSVTIVMKYYQGGSLADRIRDLGALPEKIVCSVMSSLCCALHALHQHGILHLDVKSGNILFDSESNRTFANLKLVDFGNAARIPSHDPETVEDAKEKQTKAMGTYGCMAPERFDGQYGVEADVYGAGVVLYHMVVGEIPFRGTDVYQLMVKNMQGDVSFASPRWRCVSTQLRYLAERMLDKTPETRITIPEILKMRWLFQDFSNHELVHASPPMSASGGARSGASASLTRSRGVSSVGSCNYSMDYLSRSIPKSATYA